MSINETETVATTATVGEMPAALVLPDSINKSFKYKSDYQKSVESAAFLVERNEKSDFAISTAYLRACQFYGNHGVNEQEFVNYISSLTIEKNRRVKVVSPAGSSNGSGSSILQFIKSHHINDLYLAYACSLGIDTAWQCFINSFSSDIRIFARLFSGNATIAGEIAGSIWTYLYLPSRNGRKRISTYDGRIPLTNWLRVVVSNRLANHRELKINRSSKGLDDVAESSVPFEHDKIDSAIRFRRYGVFVSDSLAEACRELTNQECLLILLRYERNLELKYISRLFNVHQSTVTRRIERTCWKIRQKVRSILIKKYKLNEFAVEECIAELLENPDYSIIGKIRESRDEAIFQMVNSQREH
jgi:RNA polymerase sigma-70 factor (ECF subfamily)